MINTFFKKLLSIIKNANPSFLQTHRKSIKNTKNSKESFYNFKEESRKRPLSFSSQRRNSKLNWTRNSTTSSSGNFPIYFPKSGYANVPFLYKNSNLKTSTKERKLLPFFVPKPYPLPPPEPLSPPPPISKPPNISSLGLNLTKNRTTFSNVGKINKSTTSSRSSINIIPLPSTKLTNSPARPKSPLLIPGALKKRNRKNRKSN